MAKQDFGHIVRKFGGKKFRIGRWYDTKPEAQKAADRLRKKYGYNVRITVRKDFEGKRKYVTWADHAV